MHKCIPTDKMGSYCSVNKQYMKKMVKSYLIKMSCTMHSEAMLALNFNDMVKDSFHCCVVRQSLYCSTEIKKKKKHILTIQRITMKEADMDYEIDVTINEYIPYTRKIIIYCLPAAPCMI